VIEGDTGGAAVPPFDYLAIKRPFGGPFMANNGFDKVRANDAIAQGRADLVAFGKPFISNPDLVTRLYLDVPLSPLNRETLSGLHRLSSLADGRDPRLPCRRGQGLGMRFRG
jgi:N-ethylmaleimide reductase